MSNFQFLHGDAIAPSKGVSLLVSGNKALNYREILRYYFVVEVKRMICCFWSDRTP
ncbi:MULTISPECIES: hypothetical protein [unclassified Tolypothrix]|uniref:hypothetical protein n=1 Tax=unclassified Tolypothrix TaxID=2649714 RepID=UPI0005EAA5D3|nr:MULTISPECIES: hypothetical protein [unclassified Tolypothrix]EKF00788.1 hypothetical protein FDUTEX481_08600 [Tolypothrix sp. PCC 7601]MBE9083452.1 hypothetical protein [Tolypothrix sp. LEGE 11397]UYD24041.1 hypothetical protein HGR01_21355 [Tolypothrix sp. PCC 7712]UYD33729.1 hypothetical protein HG267_33375 [Tolypothrix sp. PCC 7601]